MARAHTSTPAERARMVSELLAHEGDYGAITRVSRQSHVSRPTLYAWRERGRAAVTAAFAPAAPAATSTTLVRSVLTLLVEAHASEAGIRACLAELTQQSVSHGTISRILTQAGQRARALLAVEQPATPRALALDEIFGSDADHAYVSMVDGHSGAVWATAGPVHADADTWRLLQWEATDQGLRWHTIAADGGSAVHEACRTEDPEGAYQRDVWHVLHGVSRVQRPLNRAVAALANQTATIRRQVARIAAGTKPIGRTPCVDLPAHLATLDRTQYAADALRYLGQELHTLLEVVVLGRTGVLDAATRQGDLEALLDLLAELRDGAPERCRPALKRLHTSLARALPELLTFVRHLEPIQQAAVAAVGMDAIATIAWTWQRRAILGPSIETLLTSLPAAWRPVAQTLMMAWAETIRASSLAETWHSILRPHLSVHRTLSSGLVALIAVWHNHRINRRGVHANTSPLQRSGLLHADADWLTALGYPPPAHHQSPAPALALAA